MLNNALESDALAIFIPTIMSDAPTMHFPVEIMEKILAYCDSETLRALHEVRTDWQLLIKSELHLRFINIYRFPNEPNGIYVRYKVDWPTWYQGWLKWQLLKCFALPNIARICIAGNYLALTQEQSQFIRVYDIGKNGEQIGGILQASSSSKRCEEIYFLAVGNQTLPDVLVRYKKSVSFYDVAKGQSSAYTKQTFNNVFKTFRHLFGWQTTNNKSLKIARVAQTNGDGKHTEVLVVVKLQGDLLNCFLYNGICFLDMANKTLFNKVAYAYILYIKFDENEKEVLNITGEEIESRNEDFHPLVHINKDYFVAVVKIAQAIQSFIYSHRLAFIPLTYQFNRPQVNVHHIQVPATAKCCLHGSVLVAIYSKIAILYDGGTEIFQYKTGYDDMVQIAADMNDDGPAQFYAHNGQCIWMLGMK